jgi:hypothetical protein
MNRWSAAIVFGTLFCAAATFAGVDKHSPDYLRQKHAGTAAFTSAEQVADLFRKISSAASDCFTMTSKDTMMPAGSGVFVFAGGGQERVVVGTLAADDQSAWVRIEVHGIMFGPMIQVDLQRKSDETKVDVYWAHDVQGQRDGAIDVEAWLKGDLGFCKRNWAEQRAHDRDAAKKAAESNAVKK